MKLRHPAIFKLGALAGASFLRTWMSMLDYRMSFYDETIDPFHPDYTGKKIYVFWHEYITLPIIPRSHCDLAILLSQHADAEILTHLMRRCGFDTVRGSTSRGGAGALYDLCQHSAKRSLIITPDGPRGPRRRMAQGPVYLASRLGFPLVCIGLGIDRPWRLKSWDRFAIARPGSRARAVVGPQMKIPENLDRAGIEHYRLETERMLNRMTLEAEAWAESGTDKVGSIPIRRDYYFERARREQRIDAPQQQLLRGPHWHKAATGGRALRESLRP